MQFRDGQSIGWERYPRCEPSGWLEWVVVFDARVHAELHALLAGDKTAKPPAVFMTWYERLTGARANIDGMQDILAACGIFIVG